MGEKENTSDFATCNKVFIVKKKIQTEKLTIKLLILTEERHFPTCMHKTLFIKKIWVFYLKTGI